MDYTSNKDNDKDKYKKARYAAEKAVKTGKAKYRDKLEENLTTNNSKNIWQGLKAITNYKPSPKNTTATDTNLPDRLNDFYSRFDKLKLLLLPLSLPPHPSLLSQLTNMLLDACFNVIIAERLPVRITSLHVY